MAKTSEVAMENAITLKRLLEVLDSPEKSQFYVWDRERWVKVNFIDDYGLSGSCYNAKFYAFYNFRYTDLVHADSETSAWEAWLDKQDTIPESELHEAYGAYDLMRDYMIKKGYRDDEHLRDFCNRNFDLYFKWLTRADQPKNFEYPELIEGYHFQANCTGTGIVSVGHYVGFREVSLDEVVVQ